MPPTRPYSTKAPATPNIKDNLKHVNSLHLEPGASPVQPPQLRCRASSPPRLQRRRRWRTSSAASRASR
eukprot:14538324-Alexandrium_andersonii.AAC.1